MNKKNYLIIGATILVFVIAIIVILLPKNKTDWTHDILNSYNYEIKMKDCNGRENTLDKNILNYLKDNWNTLSNNGPWTGDTNNCYKTITISYENEGIIKQKQIILIDETSLVLDTGINTIYYTNSKEINDYLNNIFTTTNN